MRKLFLFICLLTSLLFAQKVKFSNKVNPDINETKKLNSNEKIIWFEGIIEDECHVYAAQKPKGDGPLSASITFETKDVQPIGDFYDAKTPIKKFDDIFAIDVYYFEGKLEFAQKIKIPNGCKSVKGKISYQVCKGETCTMETHDFTIKL